LVLYLDTPENAEVAADVGIPFERGELTEKLNQVLAMTEAERAEWGRLAAARAAERYSWNTVTDRYEALLLKLRNTT
jgi:glycosyltransferase involved in cell wall biosynthesis